MRKFLFYVFVFFNANNSFADYGVSFVRIICDQDLNYFQVQYESISGSYVGVTEYSEPKEKKRIYDLWLKNGFYDPKNLTYECKLKNHTYKVTTTQPKSGGGHCGVQPNVKLNLMEGNTVMINEVWFGPTCNGETYLDKFEMYNPGESNNFKRREIYLWLTPEPLMRSDWVLLTDTYKSIEKTIPINQSKLEEQASVIKQRNR